MMKEITLVPNRTSVLEDNLVLGLPPSNMTPPPTEPSKVAESYGICFNH